MSGLKGSRLGMAGDLRWLHDVLRTAEATAEVFLEAEDVVGVARLEIMGNVEVGPVPGCRSLARRNNSLGSEDEMGRDLGSKTNQLCLPDSLLRLDIGKDAAWNRSRCTEFNTKICTKRRCLPSFKFFSPHAHRDYYY